MHTIDNINYQCLEEIKETSIEIALVHMGKEECKPYHGVSATRDEYIIHFILSGSGVYMSNGNTWFLAPGQMFLIYPNEPVAYCADRNTPWTYVWVGFKGTKTDNILQNCGFSRENLVLPAPAPEEFMGCFDDLFKHMALSFSDDLYRRSVLLKLFAVLADHHARLTPENDPGQTDNGNNNTYISRAIDYINKMYMQDIGVSDIADNVGISRTHLNNIFQQELHTSIQKFFVDFRMHKSANLLVSTNMPIKEISGLVGYRDQLVFSRAFKNKFGVSPKSYRANPSS